MHTVFHVPAGEMEEKSGLSTKEIFKEKCIIRKKNKGVGVERRGKFQL